jgi:orotate phosphoribosyltransferase
MNEAGVLQHLRESEALLEGHFKLSSGKHSNRYFQCALVLQYPDRAGELAAGVAELVDREVDVVVGPAMGAVVWAQEVGRALGTRAIFVERVEGEFALRRNFKLAQGERVLVAEDVLTTGGSVREVIEVLRELGADVVGVASVVNRSGRNPFEDLGLPLWALVDVKAEVWEPEGCPLCAEGTPAVKPGSRPGSQSPVAPPASPASTGA